MAKNLKKNTKRDSLVALEMIFVNHLLSSSQHSINPGLVGLDLTCECMVLLQLALEVGGVPVGTLVSDCLEALVDPRFDLVSVSFELLVSEGQLQKSASTLHLLMQSFTSVHQLNTNHLISSRINFVPNFVILLTISLAFAAFS